MGAVIAVYSMDWHLAATRKQHSDPHSSSLPLMNVQRMHEFSRCTIILRSEARDTLLAHHSMHARGPTQHRSTSACTNKASARLAEQLLL
jgi:hypothetical protein